MPSMAHAIHGTCHSRLCRVGDGHCLRRRDHALSSLTRGWAMDDAHGQSRIERARSRRWMAARHRYVRYQWPGPASSAASRRAHAARAGARRRWRGGQQARGRASRGSGSASREKPLEQPGRVMRDQALAGCAGRREQRHARAGGTREAWPELVLVTDGIPKRVPKRFQGGSLVQRDLVLDPASSLGLARHARARQSPARALVAPSSPPARPRIIVPFRGSPRLPAPARPCSRLPGLPMVTPPGNLHAPSIAYGTLVSRLRGRSLALGSKRGQM
jgi:hypothetical protein